MICVRRSIIDSHVLGALGCLAIEPRQFWSSRMPCEQLASELKAIRTIFSTSELEVHCLYTHVLVCYYKKIFRVKAKKKNCHSYIVFVLLQLFFFFHIWYTFLYFLNTLVFLPFFFSPPPSQIFGLRGHKVRTES